MDTAIYRDALSLQGECPFLSLSTLGWEGYPEARTLFNLRHLALAGRGLLPPFRGHEGDFATWIGTNTSSRKTAQLRADGRSCIHYADSRGFRGLSLMGDMVFVEDQGIKAALWREGWETYYPKGPGDPDYAVFAFRPRLARYYHGLAVAEFELAGDRDGGPGSHD